MCFLTWLGFQNLPVSRMSWSISFWGFIDALILPARRDGWSPAVKMALPMRNRNFGCLISLYFSLFWSDTAKSSKKSLCPKFFNFHCCNLLIGWPLVTKNLSLSNEGLVDCLFGS